MTVDSIQKIVRLLLQGKAIDGFLGYKKVGGQVVPFFFSADPSDDLAGWVSQDPLPRYPLEKILVEIHRAHPEAKLSLLARECDTRALMELMKLNQLDPEKVLSIPLACCASDLHCSTECSHLDPRSRKVDGQVLPERGVGKFTALEQLEKLSLEERLRRWREEFAKCIKCYGCRNVCPLRVCKECSLEDEELIPTGQIPPDFSFHLIRAVHMAGFCIDCGLCEEACPAEIPLRLFYQGVNQIVAKLFGYRPGMDMIPSPFCRIGLEGVQ